MTDMSCQARMLKVHSMASMFTSGIQTSLMTVANQKSGAPRLLHLSVIDITRQGSKTII